MMPHVQMKALAKAKDWESLEAFAREKKSPIGLDPFIATAKEAGAPEATLSRQALIVMHLPEGVRKPDLMSTSRMPEYSASHGVEASTQHLQFMDMSKPDMYKQMSGCRKIALLGHA